MSGLGGHMKHIYEDLSLSKERFKQIIRRSLYGNYKFWEKIDGFNIHLMKVNGELRFARNKTDLKNGGFGLEEIKNRFSNDRVRSIYYDVLSNIGKRDEEFILGLLHEWETSFESINAEVVSNGVTNVILYKQSDLILHNIQKWSGKEPFVVMDLNCSLKGFDSEVSYTMNNQISIESIEKYVDWVFGDANSVKEFYQFKFVEYMSKYFPELMESHETVKLLFGRFFGLDNTNLKEIRKTTLWDIQGVLDKKTEIIKYCTKELDKICLRIGTLILEGCSGYRNDGWDEPIEYIKDQLAVVELDEVFEERFRNCYFKIFPFEGVVFYEINDDGLLQVYKWTGSFSPVNKALFS